MKVGDLVLFKFGFQNYVREVKYMMPNGPVVKLYNLILLENGKYYKPHVIGYVKRYKLFGITVWKRKIIERDQNGKVS